MFSTTYHIALGTQSKVKIRFLEEVLRELDIKAHISAIDVKSGVSDQPITEGETKEGSINRAMRAFEAQQSSDFGLGLEVGYHKVDDQGYEMMCSAAVFDKKKTLVQSFSSRLLLPKFHQKILSDNQYLGDHVKNYASDKADPVTNFTREMITHRGPFIKESVRNALIGYLQKD